MNTNKIEINTKKSKDINVMVLNISNIYYAIGCMELKELKVLDIFIKGWPAYLNIFGSLSVV